MSVPVWKRKLSSAEYVYQIYKLNIRLGEILMNKPQKYKTNYTDEIIQVALSALKHVQIADSIYVSKNMKESDFLVRRNNLLLARGEVQHLATSCYIYLEIIRIHHFGSQKMTESAKIYDQELEVGEMCENCYNLIKGILDHDKTVYPLFKTE